MVSAKDVSTVPKKGAIVDVWMGAGKVDAGGSVGLVPRQWWRGEVVGKCGDGRYEVLWKQFGGAPDAVELPPGEGGARSAAPAAWVLVKQGSAVFPPSAEPRVAAKKQKGTTAPDITADEPAPDPCISVATTPPTDEPSQQPSVATKKQKRESKPATTTDGPTQQPCDGVTDEPRGKKQKKAPSKAKGAATPAQPPCKKGKTPSASAAKTAGVGQPKLGYSQTARYAASAAALDESKLGSLFNESRLSREMQSSWLAERGASHFRTLLQDGDPAPEAARLSGGEPVISAFVTRRDAWLALIKGDWIACIKGMDTEDAVVCRLRWGNTSDMNQAFFDACEAFTNALVPPSPSGLQWKAFCFYLTQCTLTCGVPLSAIYPGKLLVKVKDYIHGGIRM
ncbi:DnaJ chaperone protein [Diplonema papillatum]|nr:DnaJ chaperone protein [Diplonema papillatum]